MRAALVDVGAGESRNRDVTIRTISCLSFLWFQPEGDKINTTATSKRIGVFRKEMP